MILIMCLMTYIQLHAPEPVAWDHRINLNNKFRIMSTEVIGAYFSVLFQSLVWMTQVLSAAKDIQNFKIKIRKYSGIQKSLKQFVDKLAQYFTLYC